MTIKSTLLALCFMFTAPVFAQDNWQLLCLPDSQTGCHSLWQTVNVDQNSAILFSYNVNPHQQHLTPTITIDFNNLILDADQKKVYLILDDKEKIAVPVVAKDSSGTMTNLTGDYFVENLITRLETTKKLQIQYTQNKQNYTVTIDMNGFNEKLKSMLHGQALYADVKT